METRTEEGIQAAMEKAAKRFHEESRSHLDQLYKRLGWVKQKWTITIGGETTTTEVMGDPRLFGETRDSAHGISVNLRLPTCEQVFRTLSRDGQE